MKVSVDAYNISLDQGTGVATYGRNLVSTTRSLGYETGLLYGSAAGKSKVELLNEIAFVENRMGGRLGSRWKQASDDLRSYLSGWKALEAQELGLSGKVILPLRQRVNADHIWNIRNLYYRAIRLYRAMGVRTKVRLGGVDLAHWTYPLPIEAKNALNVYTLHDLVPLRLPYTTADHKRSYYKLCKHIVQRADQILTVSEASKRDIVDILGVPEERVTNTYQSVNIAALIAGVNESAIDRTVRGLLNVEMRGYFLFFGAIEPKKNVARILEAYLGCDVSSPLVIVGSLGWGGEKETKLLASLRALDSQGRQKSQRRIIWLEHLPRETLAILIAGAKATVFPSLYEGFGLPVAESMSLGTPVITSTTSSLPEVAGAAAIFVDPYNVRSIADAICVLDSDSDMRAELSALGRRQAEKFSISAYSERLNDFYEKIK